MNIIKNNNTFIPIELCIHIFQYIDGVSDKIHYCSVNKILNRNMKITVLADQYYSTKITDACLRQNIFSNLRQLDISNNSNVKNINHLIKLKSLICRGEKSALCQNGIKKLRLEELYCRGNEHIYDISHMKNTLKYLEPNNNIRFGFHNEKFCGFSKPCIIVLALITMMLFVIFCMIWASAYYGSIKNDLDKASSYVETIAYVKNITKICDRYCYFNIYYYYHSPKNLSYGIDRMTCALIDDVCTNEILSTLFFTIYYNKNNTGDITKNLHYMDNLAGLILLSLIPFVLMIMSVFLVIGIIKIYCTEKKIARNQIFVESLKNISPNH